MTPRPSAKIAREVMSSVSGERISLFKVGTALAIAIGSWIMIYMTLKNRMTWEIFAIYLFTIGGFTQLGAFMSRYFGGKSCDPAPEPVKEIPKKESKKEDEGSD